MSHSSDSPWGRPAGQVPPTGPETPAGPASGGPGFPGSAGPSGPGPAGPSGPNPAGPAFSGIIPPGTPYYILVPGQPGMGAGAWGAPPKQPFRKRRPFLFWGLIILAIIVAGRALVNMGPGGLPVGGANIAVVNVEGMILDPKAVLEWIETVRKSPQYKGVVIRINSPGGAVAPSQEIYQAVKRLALVKPVAVSMADMAASGGYYIAVGGGKIFASPSTLTASIGVRLEVPNLEKLMDTIGVSSKTLTTGNLKDAGSYMRPMTPAEEAYLQGLINDMYQAFIEAVAEGRGMTLEEIRPLADGRAMTGRQALQAKLIDELGGLEEAGIYVAGLAGIAPGSVVLEHGPKKEEAWLKALMGAAFDLEAEYRARQQRTQFMY